MLESPLLIELSDEDREYLDQFAEKIREALAEVRVTRDIRDLREEMAVITKMYTPEEQERIYEDIRNGNYPTWFFN